MDQLKFWLIHFCQVSFLSANAMSSKWKFFASASLFWQQIYEGNLCLSSAHSYCFSCAKIMLKSMLFPVHSQDLNLHFVIALASVLNVHLHFLQSSNFGKFFTKELYLHSSNCKVLGCPAGQVPMWKLVLLPPNGCSHGELGNKIKKSL